MSDQPGAMDFGRVAAGHWCPAGGVGEQHLPGKKVGAKGTSTKRKDNLLNGRCQ